MLKSKRISFVLLFVVISFLYVGCSSSTGNYKSEIATDSISEINAMPEESFNKGENVEFNAHENREEASKDSVVQDNSNNDFNYGNRKMIKTGNITIETLNYKEAHESIIDLIERHNGYIEQMQESNSNHFNKKLKKSNITIRVPKENFNALINETGKLGYVSNKNSSVQDVSDRYFDTEARLNSLTIQEERLLTLLKKTDDLSHIIELEDKLASTRYQIENLTGTLKKFDNLIAYSTLTVNLIEVEEAKVEMPTKKESLKTRLSHNFKSSFNSTKKTAESFILFIALKSIQILLSIFIIIIIIIAIAISDKKKKNKKWTKNKVVTKEKEDEK